jgi:hypothetical protein
VVVEKVLRLDDAVSFARKASLAGPGSRGARSIAADEFGLASLSALLPSSWRVHVRGFVRRRKRRRRTRRTRRRNGPWLLLS